VFTTKQEPKEGISFSSSDLANLFIACTHSFSLKKLSAAFQKKQSLPEQKNTTAINRFIDSPIS
jgi:hypothetical protein